MQEAVAKARAAPALWPLAGALTEEACEAILQQAGVRLFHSATHGSLIWTARASVSPSPAAKKLTDAELWGQLQDALRREEKRTTQHLQAAISQSATEVTQQTQELLLNLLQGEAEAAQLLRLFSRFRSVL